MEVKVTDTKWAIKKAKEDFDRGFITKEEWVKLVSIIMGLRTISKIQIETLFKENQNDRPRNTNGI